MPHSSKIIVKDSDIAMADSVEINSDYTAQLSRDIREAGQELEECLARYRERCTGGGDGYGSLPTAGAAGEAHRLSTQDLMKVLSDMKEACDRHADDLLTTAAHFRANEAQAEAALTALRSGT
jgi:hypothetical protein